jgi:hypothetical protein
MARSKAGGGHGSRVVVRKEVRTGKAAQGRNIKAVGQIGSSMGNHATERAGKLTKSVERVEGPRPNSVQLGNANAKSCAPGPGGGRTVMRSGSQQGLTQPKPQSGGRDILSEFGPDSRTVRAPGRFG